MLLRVRYNGFMSENAPKIERQEELPERLTEQEAQNFCDFSERLISGRKLEPTTDHESLREGVWQGAKEAFLQDVVLNLKHFRRNSELEDAVRLAPLNSEDRASAELVLIKDYINQLQQEDFGFGTTPVVSRELGYKLDCVSTSAVVASILEEVGVQVERGGVYGHTVLIVRDSASKLLYADPNNIVGEITPQVEQHDGFVVYVLSEEAQADLRIPYSRIVVSSPATGFLYSMFNNMSEEVLGKYDDESRGILSRHKDDVVLQGEDLRDKLLPELVNIHEEIHKDKEFVRLESEIMDEIAKQTLGKDSITETETAELAKRVLVELLACRDKERVVLFLEGQEDQGVFAGLSPEAEKFMINFQKQLEELKGDNDRLRNYFLRRIVKTLQPEPGTT